MATAGSPAVPRIAYVLGGNVGDEPSKTYALGFVTRVPAGQTHFRVRPNVPGSVSDFDIFFYTGTEWPDAPLPNEDTADQWAHPGPHCDPVPIGAKWAIVTLSIGAADQFALTFDTAPLGC